MENGQFKFAVIMSCGNPVNAKPTTQPTPQPQPQPQPLPPAFTVQKDVRVTGGSGQFSDQIEAHAGDKLDYQITIKNTGGVDLTNLVVTDLLPDGVSFVDVPLQGSSQVTQNKISQLTGTGITIPTLTKGSQIQIQFSVTVGTKTDACAAPLLNKVRVTTANAGEKEDTASARVCLPAQTPPPPPQQPPAPQVQGAQTLADTGPGQVLGFFSVSSLLGVVAYRLKDFYLSILHR